MVPHHADAAGYCGSLNPPATRIAAAIAAAKKTDKPSLIKVNTLIGYGAPNKQGKASAHGEPLGEEEIKLTKEVENQPTKSQFTKTDATTGEELEGAKLQIIDQDGNIVEE